MSKPYITPDLVEMLRTEAAIVMDRPLVTKGQRLVIRDLLLRAARQIEGLAPDEVDEVQA